MSRTKILIIILAFIIGVLVAFSQLRQKAQPLKILSVLPPKEAINVDLNFSPQVEFDQPAKSLSLVSQPEIDYSLQTDDQTTTFVLNHSLKPETKYNLSLLSEGETIYFWSFTTRSQTESELIEEEVETALKTYPLAEFLPYETDEFQIAYEGPLYLLITIKKGVVEERKQEILNWVRFRGVDPTTHQIEWLTPEL